MKQFFIADPHFGDDRIRKYESRPFADTDEMDSTMIARWNEAVCGEDEVYVLGDFGADGREAELLARLSGTKYLIKGNHDSRSNQYYRDAGFGEVYDHPIILEGFWILSHDPVYVCTNMPYANLFGHVHANPIFRSYSAQHFCVCAERLDYRPISFEAIRKIIKEASSHE